MENNPNHRRKAETQAQSMFFNKDIDPCSIKDPAIAQIFEQMKQRLTIEISKFYNLRELYLDYWDLVVWHPGDWMAMHADNVDEERKRFTYCGWRSHSAIVYLNQDFEGGQTIFRDMNQNYHAETGKALIFPAGYDYTHGVNEVSNGKRYTVAFWFTEDPQHCIKGWELT